MVRFFFVKLLSPDGDSLVTILAAGLKRGLPRIENA